LAQRKKGFFDKKKNKDEKEEPGGKTKGHSERGDVYLQAPEAKHGHDGSPRGAARDGTRGAKKLKSHGKMTQGGPTIRKHRMKRRTKQRRGGGISEEHKQSQRRISREKRGLP